MIIKKYDYGWGDNVPLKQFQNDIVERYLKSISEDAISTVMIDSVWYSQERHKQVLDELRMVEFDRLVLIAMLDYPVPRPDWYDGIDCEVIAVGYYPGAYEIDLWALAVSEYMTVPDGLVDADNIDCAFMNLNRKPHWHRKKLYNDLESRGLLEHGLVTMGSTIPTRARLLPQDDVYCILAPNPGPEQYGIANDIMSLGNPANWRRHFLNIVTETVFDITQNNFVTEKIYKPILGMRPFLVYALGADRWLIDRGFRTYSQDFGDITDLDLTDPYVIPDFLSILIKQGPDYWRQKYIDLLPKIQYNKQRFLEYVQELNHKIDRGIICPI